MKKIFNLKLSLLLCVTVLFRFVITDDSNIVELSYGKLIGKSKLNYISFESIPYAEPPINDNRFEPPKPYEGVWNQTRDATKQIHQQCIQYDMETETVNGSEDCLYLNVFTPNLQIKKKYPVFVYIHGGSYRIGSDHMFGEEILMETNKFVFVTLNYRLGALGFLTTNCKAIPGNMGLKDQKLALKWIKQNIAHFNGDPEQIILSGFSAGGSSVHLHLLSKDIENLIKVAISYSGTAFNSWAFDYSTQPINKTIILANEFNCDMENGMKIKNCLKKIPSIELVQKSTTLFTKFLGIYPIAIFRPVVERNNISTEPFIIDYPENLIHNGQIAKIPWLVSRCADEGGILAAILLNKNSNGIENLIEFNEKFDDVLPIMFYYDDNNKNEKDMMTSYLRRMYGLNEKTQLTDEYYWNIQRMISDELMINPIEDAIKFQREFNRHGGGNIYYYIYDNPPPYGYANLISNRTDLNFGTIHGDDMLLVLKSNIRDKYPWTDIEKKLSIKFLDMYENFVKTGVPKFGNTKFPIDIVEDKLNSPKSLLITKDLV